jgi:hypothetical protein
LSIITIIIIIIIIIIGERDLIGGENIKVGHFEGRVGRLGK